MSELTDAIDKINASAAATTRTTTFFDEVGTASDSTIVTNPNNGKQTPSIKKQVKDQVTPELQKWKGEHNAQMDKFDNEFYEQAQYKPAIAWTATTHVSDKFQLYSESTNRYRPNPSKIPFTTGATIADDIANDLWITYAEATLDQVNTIANAGDSQLAGGKIWPVEDRDTEVNDSPVSVLLFNFTRPGEDRELYRAPSPVTGVITNIGSVGDTVDITVGGVVVTLLGMSVSEASRNLTTKARASKSSLRGLQQVQVVSRGNGLFVPIASAVAATYPESAKFQDADGSWWGLRVDGEIKACDILSDNIFHDMLQLMSTQLVDQFTSEPPYSNPAKTGDHLKLNLCGLKIPVKTTPTMPTCDRITICDGVLYADAGMSDSDWLLNMGINSTALEDYTNITFERVTFDSKHLCGGVYMNRYLGVNFDKCIFHGYKTFGLLTGDTGHELKIAGGTRFAEYVFAEPGFSNKPAFNGTAVQLNAPDNELDDVVMLISKKGLHIKSQYNTVGMLHVYGIAEEGVYVDNSNINTVGTVLDNCYFDVAKVKIRNPNGVTVTNSKFLGTDTDPNFSFIELEITEPSTFIIGLKVTGNHFRNLGSTTVKGVNVVGSGTISANNVYNTDLTGNSFDKVYYFTSKATEDLYVANGDTWDFDLSNKIPFGAIAYMNFSAEDATANFAIFKIQTYTGLTAKVKSSINTSAVVRIEADISRVLPSTLP